MRVLAGHLGFFKNCYFFSKIRKANILTIPKCVITYKQFLMKFVTTIRGYYVSGQVGSA